MLPVSKISQIPQIHCNDYLHKNLNFIFLQDFIFLKRLSLKKQNNSMFTQYTFLQDPFTHYRYLQSIEYTLKLL